MIFYTVILANTKHRRGVKSSQLYISIHLGTIKDLCTLSIIVSNVKLGNIVCTCNLILFYFKYVLEKYQ